MYKSINKYIIASALGIVILGPFFPVYAQNLSSPNYHLELGNISFDGPTNAPQPREVGLPIHPVKQEEPKELYDDKGYFVQEGFSYLNQDQAFTLTIQPTLISYDSLFPDQPLLKEVKLTINPGGSDSYQVLAALNGSLKTKSSQTIASTTCDDPARPCSTSVAALWDSANTYGFGFTVKGEDTLPDFDNGHLFRSFADLHGKEAQLVQIINGLGTAADSQRASTLRLKLNISENQPSGIYQSSLVFLALPSY